MEILAAIHDTAFSTWVRESTSLFAFTGLLFLHAIGLAFAVGVTAVIGLRILGVAPRLPLAPMEKLFPVIWVGFWINALSGVPILMANADQDLINPVFYTKMLFIALAVVSVRLVKSQVFRNAASLETTPAERRETRDNPVRHAGAFRGRANLDMTPVATLDPPVAVPDATPVQTIPLPTKAKILAAASLAFWGGAIVAGRLTEYPSLFRLDYLR